MKKLLFLTLFTLALALLPIMALRGDLWLSSDFLHQEISFILETKRILATGAPWWSWNTYLGSDFIGSYAFYTLTSPFVWINCLMPESFIGYSVAITFVLKFLCMAWLAWVYLRKMGVSSNGSALGAYLFTFSSFNIASLYYYHFYEPIIVFLLLLIAVERLLRRERWGMTCVTIASFAVVFVNFYFAIGTLIFTLLYVIFRALSSEIDFSFKVAARGLVAVMVGVLMCSALLLPVMNQMLITTRVDAQSGIDSVAFLNIIERFRTLFMPKVLEGTTVFVPGGSGSFSNEACIAVFGLSLAMIYAWRHRDWLAALLITSLVFYLTPLNGVFTLFTNPLYTRWAYALTLVIVLCSARVLDENRSVKRGVVSYSIIASAIVLVFVALVVCNGGIHFPGPRFCALVVLFFAGIIALSLWGCGKLPMRWLKVAVLACVVGQMWLFLLNLGSDTRSYKTLMQNVERGSDVVTSRTDFRADKGFLYFNAGLLRNRASVSGYHSVIMRDVDVFLRTATHDFWAKNKLRPNIHQDEMDALLSVKTIYDIDSVGNVEKRVNKYFIPMGFAFDKYILESDFLKLREMEEVNLPLLMLSAMVSGEGHECMSKMNLSEPIDLDSVVAKRREFTATDFKGTSTGFTAKVNLPSTKMMFFSVPFSKGFTARIDGNVVPIYKANLCMMALKVPGGKHSITFDYFPPGLRTGMWLSMLGFLLLLIIFFGDKSKITAHRNKR